MYVKYNEILISQNIILKIPETNSIHNDTMKLNIHLTQGTQTTS